ncbi:transcriptional regulator, AsnC family [Sphingomonas palmae]|uniref:Transcriptional regulator, AsnC family n=1 Tax=Sphingomonas palmae TaxID=1855283 RepID=A0A1H7M688_9SPHN|nr:Lrp/AsnC family transcriptional regulator [Sphingomonas palmae]SEL06641.1 transcriptional regulator, AsnC family [Sphingomonas palmae]
MNQITALDEYDRRILLALTQDGRMSWRDLAEKIGLSLTPTLRRVRLLEERGIIVGYAAQIDERLLLGSMVIFLSVTLERQTSEVIQRVEEQLAIMPEVMTGHQMSGDADMLLRIVVRGLEHYRSFIQRVTAIPGIAHLHSSFALKSFVNRTSPPIPDHPSRRG